MVRPQANNVILDYAIESGPNILDIPRGLSILNRKSYRSGYLYSVDFVEYIGTAGDEVRTICLPCSYPLFQSYRLGFEEWKKQRAEAVSETGIKPGRWSDFKPFYNESHFDGTLPEVMPMGMSVGFTMVPLSVNGAEWNRADLVINDPGTATTSNLQVGMLGADNLAAPYGSLMNAYGDTRVATLAPDPLNPTAASVSWITKTGSESSEMSQDVINLIEDENDLPPYANQADVTLPPIYVGGDQSSPGGLMMDTSKTGTTGRAVTLDGGLVPLGLIVVTQGGSVEGGILRVHVTRGTYKGVAALPMGDFS